MESDKVFSCFQEGVPGKKQSGQLIGCHQTDPHPRDGS